MILTSLADLMVCSACYTILDVVLLLVSIHETAALHTSVCVCVFFFAYNSSHVCI